MLNGHGKDALPEGAIRPKQILQLTLFSENRNAFLATAKVSLDDLLRWHENGWLSFDARTMESLDQPLICEVLFLRDITRSGLSDAQIEDLLKGLSKPYRYDPNRLAYSFCHGWIEVFSPPNIDMDEIMEERFEEWLEEKLLDDDAETVFQIQEVIAKALEKR